MSLQSVPPLCLEFFSSRPVHVEVSTAPLTSDAGLLPVRQFDERIGFTEQFAAALRTSEIPPSPSSHRSLVGPGTLPGNHAAGDYRSTLSVLPLQELRMMSRELLQSYVHGNPSKTDSVH